MSEWRTELRVGVVRMEGTDAVELLNRLSTNDVSNLSKSMTKDTLLVNNQGKLIDWIRAHCIDASTIQLITTEHRAKSVADWIERYTIMEDCETRVVGESVSLWRWCCSEAAEIVSDEGLSSMPTPRGFPDGIDSLEARLVDISERTPTIGASEFDHLRISFGIPGAATEYPVPVNPLELRLAGSAISFSKGCYIGQEVLSRMDSYDKVSRYLMGWTGRDDDIRVSLESRLISNGKRVGRITSATPDGTRGLAILNRDVASPRTLTLRTDSREWEVELVDLPFWS